jgi:hypothetical protein
MGRKFEQDTLSCGGHVNRTSCHGEDLWTELIVMGQKCGQDTLSWGENLGRAPCHGVDMWTRYRFVFIVTLCHGADMLQDTLSRGKKKNKIHDKLYILGVTPR